jgi:hypothetical protein
MIGGTVTGLVGSGLELRNNAGNPLAVSANGTFTFSGTVASGGAYSVTVGVQPTSPSQTCSVAAGSGTAMANVTNVSVTCTTLYAVGVTVDGLFGTGLVLENNGGDPLAISANGAAEFSTDLASGAAYNVAVRTQPTSTPAQTCTVTSGTGTVGNGAVTGISVSCRAQAGRFVYVAVAGMIPAGNAVAGFTIDADTGALTPMPQVPTTGLRPRWVFTDLSGQFLYVYGDDFPTDPGPTTLEGFSVNQQTGALTPIPGSLVNLAAAAGVPAFHPNGRFMYFAISDGGPSGNNRLHGREIEPTGLLTNLPGFPRDPFGAGDALSLGGVVLSPNGASLYFAHLTPANPPSPATATVRQLTLDAQTGEVIAEPSQVSVQGVTFNQLFLHSAGTHIYTRNSAPAGALTSRFTVDATTGAIGSRIDIDTALGFGVVFAPSSRVYFPVLGGTFGSPAPGSVAGYVDSASANPAVALSGSPWPTDGTNSTAAVLDPTGRFIATTNLGSQNITVFKIDAAQGSLAHVPGSPYAPAIVGAPGTVTFDPSARFAYLTEATTNSISSYAIDVDTGHPTFVNSQITGGSPSIVPLKILGRQ